MLDHTEDKLLDCDVCGKHFTEIGEFKKHVLTHTGNKPIACEVCCESFADVGE